MKYMYIDEILDIISETYDSTAYEAITGILWQDGTPWQLVKFERDIELDGEWYRVVLIEKITYDSDDLEAVDYSEDILFEAWRI
jgi:hypothetical protein